MKKQIILIALFAALAPVALIGQEIDRSFDWESYKGWEDKTVYSKAYVVDQKHPQASDDNPGTAERPFLTIGKAAQTVAAGEQIIIRAGVYREMIELKNQGTAEDKMISIEAAPGEQVTVKGSRILNAQWTQKPVMTEDYNPSIYTWSRKIWLTAVPASLFDPGYNPFVLPNIEPYHYELMPWASLAKGLPPYNLPRAMIFQNGRRMTQLAHPGDLIRLPGSFWVAPGGETLCIHPYGSGNPNADLFEAAALSHLFKPQGTGYGYVRLAGLAFEHCANGFLRTSTGAVTIMGGHHWIIENNTIGQVNASGLEFGRYAYEPADKNPANIRLDRQRADEPGRVIARNNIIHNCGTAGIRCYNVVEGLVVNNIIRDCGWQDSENHWEVAGIKLLRTRRTIVKGNHVYNIQGGNGIWLDWDNQYSRVTANLIHNIQAMQAGVFIEASQYPNMVDNNIICDIDGHGLFGDDSDEVIFAHNLVANTTAPYLQAITNTNRRLNGRQLSATRNTIANNIFINGHPIKLDAADNAVRHNLYVNTGSPLVPRRAATIAAEIETSSQTLEGFFEFIAEPATIVWRLTQAPAKVPTLPALRSAYGGSLRQGAETVPGPFTSLPASLRVAFNGDGNISNK
ncbi:MAG: right-handed parallel beta-helix repeat-containing protein [Tannerellaceae bacterium]|jgi:hypothetical protein|nr:right-handed parallel beta-helix repeat-containing protein [Tannerellaceae bacterium]